ncbi:cobalt-factor II C(20)-methyltransferase [Clostridium frigidicarnis]|uniref:Cobalt-precorrin-2 C(20)-methyltransferase n=1 Tax=Clostridium frigidicarnis TaxID=84698 RepID=A0A1I0XYI6_9CLOT|nr:cobalt-factor II C(20)-methyltransferase [Clostridium frigidicarnis]SFB06081.1 cobalt-factor II C20-methyltransferase [Clostridium frigidicarnis]
MGKLIGIGVGPGDKELITLKALKAIENADVIIAPTAMENGVSIALETVKEYIKPNTEVMIKHFPMGKDDREEKAYEAYKTVEELVETKKTVVFLTIGDPYVYSTYIHMLTHMEKKGFDVETIPGITSFCAAASIIDRPLVIGNEPLLIIPANRVKDIRDEKYVVIMKLYKEEENVISFLEEKGFDYVYVSRAGREGQRVLKNKDEILKLRDYMSLIIASR